MFNAFCHRGRSVGTEMQMTVTMSSLDVYITESAVASTTRGHRVSRFVNQ